MREEALVIPVITTVIQTIKEVGLPKKFLKPIALILGVAFSLWSNHAATLETVLLGFSYGLSAIGGYELLKDPINTAGDATKDFVGRMVK